MKLEKSGDTALPDCSGKRFTLVIAQFYSELAGWLEQGAREALQQAGVAPSGIRVVRVPGCFELPLAAKRAIEEGADAVVALGVVVRGETPHFEYVAGECARGIMQVQLEHAVPIGFGVLTTETLAQAEERADPKRGNKGYAAALAAAMMAGGERVAESDTDSLRLGG